MRDEYDTKNQTTTQQSHPYGAKEICQSVGISHRQLDYWVLIGVVTPYLERHGAKLFRRFSLGDVAVLRRIKLLIDEGVVVSRAAERVHREMKSKVVTRWEPTHSGDSASAATPLDEREPATDAA
jgi:DNA-binding transcriptional MerR regulator